MFIPEGDETSQREVVGKRGKEASGLGFRSSPGQGVGILGRGHRACAEWKRRRFRKCLLVPVLFGGVSGTRLGW